MFICYRCLMSCQIPCAVLLTWLSLFASLILSLASHTVPRMPVCLSVDLLKSKHSPEFPVGDMVYFNYWHNPILFTYHIFLLVYRLNTHKKLYDCLREVVHHGDKFPTTDVDKLVAKLFLFDFEQSGKFWKKPYYL